mmetsp:Transcript_31766/g.65248  ORF Transcript_31766/g.65248 Transcript_31766/m.65248 type:complete len:274 (+) Transcript_31766:651-1472(+)
MAGVSASIVSSEFFWGIFMRSFDFMAIVILGLLIIFTFNFLLIPNFTITLTLAPLLHLTPLTITLRLTFLPLQHVVLIILSPTFLLIFSMFAIILRPTFVLLFFVFPIISTLTVFLLLSIISSLTVLQILSVPTIPTHLTFILFLSVLSILIINLSLTFILFLIPCNALFPIYLLLLLFVLLRIPSIQNSPPALHKPPRNHIKTLDISLKDVSIRPIPLLERKPHVQKPLDHLHLLILQLIPNAPHLREYPVMKLNQFLIPRLLTQIQRRHSK